MAQQPEHAGVGGATLLPPHSIPISHNPDLRGMALNVYAQGIEFGDQASLMAGLALFGALIGGTGAIANIYMTMAGEVRFHIFLFLLSIFFVFLCYAGIRWDTSGYRYSPILFDRAARKVHIFVDRTRFWWPWPLIGGGKYEIRSYDWDCVRAQIKRFTIFSGSVSRTDAMLELIVLKAPDDPTIIDQTGLGYATSAMLIQPLIDAWEHLRCFMRHEGPLLAETDATTQEDSLNSLWGAITFLQPFFGPGSEENWRKRNVMLWVGQILALLIFPYTLFVGLWHWAVLHLKSQPKWPADILASIGEGPLKGDALKRWRNFIPAKSKHRR
jgi:hypothetical protein